MAGTATPALTHPALTYLSGFGNRFETEAIAGALPVGRNSPQRAPHGLYTELLSGSAFTTPRDHNLRTWMYRIRPSAMHRRFDEISAGAWQTAPFTDAVWNGFTAHFDGGTPPSA
ncbi:hypothetical protein C7R54_20675 [Achromobacter aloeverae]|uniref:Homogentisate 1,2-dioxygenase N-terminal domain-containing protein n=1 Tax=Achromobacter aloeverae TaxID=1750518 RepID=A0A4Q1HGD4_9BURK|nr:hypothetical protein C7R54_20675 [Achromobacter aloeverae]